MAKRSNSDFKYFVERCKHWIDILGLKDWSITYDFHDHEGRKIDASLSYSQHFHLLNRNVKISLNSTFRPIDKDELDEVALHECLELLLLEMTNKLDHFVSSDLSESMTHQIIHRLERAMLRKRKH